MALVRRPVIFLQTLAARAEPKAKRNGLSRQDGAGKQLNIAEYILCLSKTLETTVLIELHRESMLFYRWMLAGALQSPS